MNFSIEVPGETNPFNLQDLCRVLEAATSNNHTQRQSATQQLGQWETTAEYFPALQTVFLDRSLPYAVRFLAIIQLKNGVDKYWRHISQHNAGGLLGGYRRLGGGPGSAAAAAAAAASTSTAIPRQERDVIRARLFQGTIGEPDAGLALHNALVVAKVVRIDYPQEWPDAMSDLCSLVRASMSGAGGQQAPQHLSGALSILLRVVKELASARLRRSQTALQGVAPEIVFLLVDVYRDRTAAWTVAVQQQQAAGGGVLPGVSDPATELAMKNSLLALRVLRRLIAVGYESPHQDKVVQQFWALSQAQFGQFLELAESEGNGGAARPYQDLAGRHLLQFTKLHIDMSDSHPASFVVLPDTLPLVRAYWLLVARFAEGFDKSGGLRQASSSSAAVDGGGGGGGATAKAKVEGPLLERLALKGLLLLRGCVRTAWYPQTTFKYKSVAAKEEETQAVHVIKEDLLTEELVVQMVNVIITHLFVFRKADLDAWEQDAEEWEEQERNQGSAWEWEVRPCAEKLFLDLLTHYKDVLLPLLLAYFRSVQADPTDIVAKEAAYTVMGLGAAVLYDSFDFDEVLATTVSEDARRQGTLLKILRRRIAILVSQWVAIRMTSKGRAIAYDMFRHFLDPSDQTNDAVVRITAAREFYVLAEELDFEEKLLLPNLAEYFSRLVGLVQEVELDPTKLAILETLRSLILRMAPHADQFGDYVMSALPAIWDAAEKEEYMIKQSVMSILSAVVVATRTESARYQALMLPLLTEALNPGSELYIHLVDESLELWDSILSNSAPPLSPHLVSLLGLALPLLEYQSDAGSRSIEVVRMYAMLAPQQVLSDEHRRPVITALMAPLASPGRERVSGATDCMAAILQASQEFGGGAAGAAIIVVDMLETGMLRGMVGALRGAWEAHQTSGPNRRSSTLSTVAETQYLCLLARLAIANPEAVATALATFGHGAGAASGNATGASGASPLAELWGWLSTEWFAAMDVMAVLDERKVACLGLTSLLELPEPMHSLVLPRLQDYLSLWTSVALDVAYGVAGDNGTAGPDTLFWKKEEDDDVAATGKEENNTSAAAKPPPPKEAALTIPDREPLDEDDDDAAPDLPKEKRQDELAYRDPAHALDTRTYVLERLASTVARAGGPDRFAADWVVNVDADVREGFERTFGVGMGASRGVGVEIV